jgi:hypothetical protein
MVKHVRKSQRRRLLKNGGSNTLHIYAVLLGVDVCFFLDLLVDMHRNLYT